LVETMSPGGRLWSPITSSLAMSAGSSGGGGALGMPPSCHGHFAGALSGRLRSFVPLLAREFRLNLLLDGLAFRRVLGRAWPDQ
jgi:hypothetical protein